MREVFIARIVLVSPETILDRVAWRVRKLARSY